MVHASQLSSLRFDKSFVLCDILEQRFDPYPAFTKLPQVSGLPHVNLKTMWDRAKRDPDYGPNELLRDAAIMGRNMPATLSQLFRGHRTRTNRWLRLFPRFLNSLTAEVKEFESCPDCVTHYYCTSEPFLIPCRKPQSVRCKLLHVANCMICSFSSLLVVSLPLEKLLFPAKALAIDQDGEMVRIGLFDAANTRMWLPRSSCVLLCMRTWHHMWSRDWAKPRKQNERAFADLFRHLLLLTARTGRWFVGAQTGGQTVSQATLFAPDSFFAPIAQCRDVIDSLFIPHRQAVVQQQLQVQQRPEKQKRTPRTRVKCWRSGCRKRLTRGWQCPLCDVKYCSSQCEQQDIAAHKFCCSMAKAPAQELPVLLSDETFELIREALGESTLFWSDYSQQFVDNGVEQLLQ